MLRWLFTRYRRICLCPSFGIPNGRPVSGGSIIAWAGTTGPVNTWPPWPRRREEWPGASAVFGRSVSPGWHGSAVHDSAGARTTTGQRDTSASPSMAFRGAVDRLLKMLHQRVDPRQRQRETLLPKAPRALLTRAHWTRYCCRKSGSTRRRRFVVAWVRGD